MYFLECKGLETFVIGTKWLVNGMGRILFEPKEIEKEMREKRGINVLAKHQ